MRALLASMLAGAALTAASGCVIVAEDALEIGGLVVEWSIAGDVDPLDCELVGARRAEVAVFDRFDRLVVELEPRCRDFAVGTDLPEGRYTVETTLVDGFDRAVSFTLVESVTIVEDTRLSLFVDFAPDDLF